MIGCFRIKVKFGKMSQQLLNQSLVPNWKCAYQASKVILAYLHYAGGLHQTVCVKLYLLHFFCNKSFSFKQVLIYILTSSDFILVSRWNSNSVKFANEFKKKLILSPGGHLYIQFSTNALL